MKLVGITRRPIFWVLFFAASIGGIFFSYHYFSKALSIVNLDVRMSRESALKRSRNLAKRLGWGPKNFHQAASFESDNNAQIFVELEGGGKKAFNKMLETKLYEPYTWKVRHFRESQEQETVILFTPEGKPYGFKEVIPETVPGPDLSAQEAETAAQREARQKWGISFDLYKRVQVSKKIHPSGRSDHTFFYERPEKNIGEGRYWLQLVVSGNKLTQLTHSLKIPDDFMRRYQEMRAANKTISTAASVAFVLLYLLIGCLLALFFLFRSRYIIWTMPLFWAGIVALLHFASGLNNIPIAWMGYDTALSAGDFLLRYLMQISISTGVRFVFAGLVFAMAESLTRKAFGNHIQFWKLWSPNVASSSSVLGRTVGGYMIISLQLSLVIGTYLFANKFFGWWWPSSVLTSPNILATYFPWLAPLSNALTAGFIEECLFRALPIAGAVLLGRKLGKEKLFLILAFVLQAIIFGAAHANYLAQPAYARLIELIIPSFIFGGMYLFYGLLPAIISHFTFDLVLMSMPLFVSSAPGMWTHRIIVILAGLIPLFAVIFARLRAGTFKTLKQEYYNKSWTPPEPKNQKTVAIASEPQEKKLSTFVKKITMVAGLAGIVTWIFFTPFKQNSPPLTISRTEAIKLAKKELKKQNVHLDETWQALTILSANYKTEQQKNWEHTFVWQKDKELAKKLVGTYLPPAQWVVRFVTFTGDVAKRSEEYQITITEDGKIIRFAHKLPDKQTGKKLTEQEARTIAENFLTTKLNLQPKQLKEISAQSKKQPNRVDWLFTFSNPAVYSLKEGEARITVEVDGDKVQDYTRYIFVPEEWKRQERQRANRENIILIASLMLLFLVLSLALLRGNGTVFAVRIAGYAFLFMLIYSLISVWNNWSMLIAQFNTNEPFTHQLFSLFAQTGLGSLIRSGLFALLFGLTLSHKKVRSFFENTETFATGFSLGAIALGLNAVANYFTPSLKPLWANFDRFGMYLPTVGTILFQLINYLVIVLLLLVVLGAIDRKLSLFQKNKLPLSLFFVCIGIAVQGIQEITTTPFWLLSGVGVGLLLFIAYQFILQFNRHLAVPALACFMCSSAIQQALFQAYPGALFAYLLAGGMILATSVFLFERSR